MANVRIGFCQLVICQCRLAGWLDVYLRSVSAHAAALMGFTLCACAQKTMLKTYISRIYYPFIVREPDIGNSNGCDWAVWLYSPYRPDSAGTSVRLGLALLLPSFDFLPETLNSIEDILYGSGMPAWRSAEGAASLCDRQCTSWSQADLRGCNAY